jgi:hypothetical protein
MDDDQTRATRGRDPDGIGPPACNLERFWTGGLRLARPIGAMGICHVIGQSALVAAVVGLLPSFPDGGDRLKAIALIFGRSQ